MKKLLSVILAVALLVCLSVSPAFAAGKLSVVKENYYTVAGYSTYGYLFAKVENVGDKPIKLNAGVLEIYDANGDALTSSDYVYNCARYLQPGEYTYAQMYAQLEDGATPADYMVTFTGKSDSDYTDVRLPVTTDLKLNVEDGWWIHNYMYATVTNNTDADVYGINVVLALLDAEGNILYMDADSLYSERALTPGSSMIIRKDIPSAFIEHFTANGIVPASVDAFAYVEVSNAD